MMLKMKHLLLMLLVYMLTSSALFIKINSGLLGMGIKMMYLYLIYFIFFSSIHHPFSKKKEGTLCCQYIAMKVFEKRDKLTLNSSPIPHLSGHKNRVVHSPTLYPI